MSSLTDRPADAAVTALRPPIVALLFVTLMIAVGAVGATVASAAPVVPAEAPPEVADPSVPSDPADLVADAMAARERQIQTAEWSIGSATQVGRLATGANSEFWLVGAAATEPGSVVWDFGGPDAAGNSAVTTDRLGSPDDPLVHVYELAGPVTVSVTVSVALGATTQTPPLESAPCGPAPDVARSDTWPAWSAPLGCAPPAVRVCRVGDSLVAPEFADDGSLTAPVRCQRPDFTVPAQAVDTVVEQSFEVVELRSQGIDSTALGDDIGNGTVDGGAIVVPPAVDGLVDLTGGVLTGAPPAPTAAGPERAVPIPVGAPVGAPVGPPVGPGESRDPDDDRPVIVVDGTALPLDPLDPERLARALKISVDDLMNDEIVGTEFDDFVELFGAVDNGSVTLLDGNDTVTMSNNTVTNSRIDLGPGDGVDVVSGTNVQIERTEIVLGGGGDEVTITGVLRDVVVRQGDGTGFVLLVGQTDRGDVDLGDGADELLISGEFSDGNIFLGAGDDVGTLIGNATGGRYGLGDGDDQLLLDGGTIDGLVVDLGGGLDRVVIGSTFTGTVTIDDPEHSRTGWKGDNLRNNDTIILAGEGWARRDREGGLPSFVRTIAGAVVATVNLASENVEIVATEGGEMLLAREPKRDRKPWWRRALSFITSALKWAAVAAAIAFPALVVPLAIANGVTTAVEGVIAGCLLCIAGAAASFIPGVNPLIAKGIDALRGVRENNWVRGITSFFGPAVAKAGSAIENILDNKFIGALIDGAGAVGQFVGGATGAIIDRVGGGVGRVVDVVKNGPSKLLALAEWSVAAVKGLGADRVAQQRRRDLQQLAASDPLTALLDGRRRADGSNESTPEAPSAGAPQRPTTPTGRTLDDLLDGVIDRRSTPTSTPTSRPTSTPGRNLIPAGEALFVRPDSISDILNPLPSGATMAAVTQGRVDTAPAALVNRNRSYFSALAPTDRRAIEGALDGLFADLDDDLSNEDVYDLALGVIATELGVDRLDLPQVLAGEERFMIDGMPELRSGFLPGRYLLFHFTSAVEATWGAPSRGFAATPPSSRPPAARPVPLPTVPPAPAAPDTAEAPATDDAPIIVATPTTPTGRTLRDLLGGVIDRPNNGNATGRAPGNDDGAAFTGMRGRQGLGSGSGPGSVLVASLGTSGVIPADAFGAMGEGARGGGDVLALRRGWQQILREATEELVEAGSRGVAVAGRLAGPVAAIFTALDLYHIIDRVQVRNELNAAVRSGDYATYFDIFRREATGGPEAQQAITLVESQVAAFLNAATDPASTGAGYELAAEMLTSIQLSANLAGTQDGAFEQVNEGLHRWNDAAQLLQQRNSEPAARPLPVTSAPPALSSSSPTAARVDTAPRHVEHPLNPFLDAINRGQYAGSEADTDWAIEQLNGVREQLPAPDFVDFLRRLHLDYATSYASEKVRLAQAGNFTDRADIIAFVDRYITNYESQLGPLLDADDAERLRRALEFASRPATAPAAPAIPRERPDATPPRSPARPDELAPAPPTRPDDEPVEMPVQPAERPTPAPVEVPSGPVHPEVPTVRPTEFDDPTDGAPQQPIRASDDDDDEWARLLEHMKNRAGRVADEYYESGGETPDEIGRQLPDIQRRQLESEERRRQLEEMFRRGGGNDTQAIGGSPTDDTDESGNPETDAQKLRRLFDLPSPDDVPEGEGAQGPIIPGQGEEGKWVYDDLLNPIDPADMRRHLIDQERRALEQDLEEKLGWWEEFAPELPDNGEFDELTNPGLTDNEWFDEFRGFLEQQLPEDVGPDEIPFAPSTPDEIEAGRRLNDALEAHERLSDFEAAQDKRFDDPDADPDADPGTEE